MNRRWTGLAMGAVAASALVACGGSDGPSMLTYRVEGSADEAVVRYVDADGTTSEETTVPLPFSLDLEIDGSAGFELYATNAGTSGTVTCEVLFDEESVGSAEGRQFAGCEGDASGDGDSLDITFLSYEDVSPDGYDPPVAEPAVSPELTGSILYAGHTPFDDNREFVVLEPAPTPTTTAWSEGLQGSASCPRLSPDGTRLAFTSVAERAVFVVGVDGSGLTQVSPPEVRPGFCADWTPDSSGLAYTVAYSGPDGAVRSIVISFADGSGHQELEVSEEDAVDIDYPTWSPDGTRIAFISHSGAGKVSVIGPSGTIEEELLAVGVRLIDLHWSPDGTHFVAACAKRGEAAEGVCTFDADGTNVEFLTDDTISGVFGTSWSPDGEWIVFNGEQDESNGLFVVAADGSRTFRLAEFEDGSAEWPSWYPEMELPTEPVSLDLGG